MTLQLTGSIYCFSFFVNLNLDFHNKTKQFDYMMDRKHFFIKGSGGRENRFQCCE